MLYTKLVQKKGGAIEEIAPSLNPVYAARWTRSQYKAIFPRFFLERDLWWTTPLPPIPLGVKNVKFLKNLVQGVH